MKNSVKQHASALTAVLACLALALVLYHSLAGGTLLQSSPYNSYALQAENWLAGQYSKWRKLHMAGIGNLSGTVLSILSTGASGTDAAFCGGSRGMERHPR